MQALKRRELKDGDKIFFTAITKECGRAEFTVCPVYKRGKLKELYLYPKQQPNAKEYFVFLFDYEPLDWCISSWAHRDLDNPWIWRYWWCKEHKSLSFDLYVPHKAKYFEVHTLSNFSIHFGR